MARQLQCSFCRKSENEVAKLVAGPHVYICDACVKIAADIMERDGPAHPRGSTLRRLFDRLFGPRFAPVRT